MAACNHAAAGQCKQWQPGKSCKHCPCISWMAVVQLQGSTSGSPEMCRAVICEAASDHAAA